MAKFDSRLDLIFTALGDPTRRTLLDRLARCAASVGELAAPHDMALPSLLAHLRKLEAAGLVTSQKVGRVRTYSLAPDALSPARHWLDAQRDTREGRLDRLDEYATRLHARKRDGPESGD